MEVAFAATINAFEDDEFPTLVHFFCRDLSKAAAEQADAINGNLTYDGAVTLEHDAENRLVSATDGSSGAAYAFDGRGRRKLKAVGETSVTISVTDADNREVLEYDGLTGALRRWHAYGPGPNAVVSQVDLGADTRTTPIPNLLGSIVGAYDSAGALARYGYQPYGSGSPAPQFAYTGQRIDPETGRLYYYRARHYSTAFGRFLQPDPIGYSGGMHLYGYVENDPLNGVDPEGLAWTAISGGFQSLTQSDFAATASGLFQKMVDPYVGFYQRSVVQPFYAGVAAVAQSPAGDPALYASLQGLGAPGALASAAGHIATSAISVAARFATRSPSPVSSPNFVVSPGGTAFPVPSGAQGPVPVINRAGNQTGVAFTGGAGGANGQVSTIRLMDPVPPRGSSPGYPTGYVRYENNTAPRPQAVDPYSGKTLPRTEGHYPID